MIRRKFWSAPASKPRSHGVSKLISTAKSPRSIQLDQHPLDSFTYDPAEGLLYLRFPNEARPRNLVVAF